MESTIAFGPQSPFDREEQSLIHAVVAALEASTHPERSSLAAEVVRHVALLDRQGALMAEYPPISAAQVLGARRRDVRSLLQLLSHSNPANFDMFLPTRALFARNLVMAEVNFYRLLRFACEEALPSSEADELLTRVERLECHCLYTRLCEEVLTHIASDAAVTPAVRERAVLSLSQMWDRVTYRVSEFFPVLEATWDARRRVAATFGTLMGASEVFCLLQAGCAPEFVEHLVRPEYGEDEAAAFREFLFGATTEQLERMSCNMEAAGRSSIGAREVSREERTTDPGEPCCDPANAFFEFFLARHLQAAARRQAGLVGPKRTAEEYVMLAYLEHLTAEHVSDPPSSRAPEPRSERPATLAPPA
ncbi:MAG: hypothetical protein HY908_29935 [Myxococcales bacterium]|nr:hypothetical protein [Myxococcales bacterium]